MNDDTPPEDDLNPPSESIDELVIEEAETEEELEKESALIPSLPYPEELYIMPLNRRPFFPGMAAPIVIEPGAYYEVLKIISKTEHKCVGLFLTHNEDSNIYEIAFDDIYQIGVVARILRIIPIEQGGAQVVLNMEKRVEIIKPLKNKYL